jgi:hypothetical protein
VLGRASLLGQPLNPLLTVLPLGILGSALLVDLGALISGSQLFGAVALADIAVGLFAAGVSFCAVLIDLIIARPGGLARQVLPWVAALTGSMVVIFMVVWSVRSDGDRAPSGGTLLWELLALSAGIVAAIFARRLALGHGIPQHYLDTATVAGRLLAAATVAAGVLARRNIGRSVARGSLRVVSGSLWVVSGSQRAAEAVRTGPLARLMR